MRVSCCSLINLDYRWSNISLVLKKKHFYFFICIIVLDYGFIIYLFVKLGKSDDYFIIGLKFRHFSPSGHYKVPGTINKQKNFQSSAEEISILRGKESLYLEFIRDLNYLH